MFLVLSFSGGCMCLKTPTTAIIITTVHNSSTQLYCELAIERSHTRMASKNKTVTPTKIYIHLQYTQADKGLKSITVSRACPGLVRKLMVN